ncbi:aminoglycoside phosphotransferase family protein [Sphingomicrobium flavum]|uniref:aminoglycoside phosphotransferase family protein n=1 Tax=Sphingomicrobium flavum TaxID=1229164 RepID=UPI0021AD82AE|nr:phosphotransferase [Sphingomicrobium flavum]
MIPPATAPDFLTRAGWGGARIDPLAGDASFRRYFRVHHDTLGDAVLMDAPPAHEDVRPFIAIAEHLEAANFRAPRILARDLDEGLLLLEDFGDDRVGPVLARDAARERAIYERAVDILVDLHRHPLPREIAPYSEEAKTHEVALFPDWYAKAAELGEIDDDGFFRAWQAAWPGLIARTEQAPVLVLRDYHADNLMILKDGELGLLDFQDALAGHPAYDLVSLLQDARRDVSPELEREMLDRYMDKAGIEDRESFEADYQLLGAQRNVKILGIFTRLWKRDGKPHYLSLQPRVWGLVERNFTHPVNRPIRDWFDTHVPAHKRADFWSDC